MLMSPQAQQCLASKAITTGGAVQSSLSCVGSARVDCKSTAHSVRGAEGMTRRTLRKSALPTTQGPPFFFAVIL